MSMTVLVTLKYKYLNKFIICKNQSTLINDCVISLTEAPKIDKENSIYARTVGDNVNMTCRYFFYLMFTLILKSIVAVLPIFLLIL